LTTVSAPAGADALPEAGDDALLDVVEVVEDPERAEAPPFPAGTVAPGSPAADPPAAPIVLVW
jgi:hypothetical protein